MGVDKRQKLSDFISDHNKDSEYTDLNERQILGRIRDVKRTISGLERQLKDLRHCLAKM